MEDRSDSIIDWIEIFAGPPKIFDVDNTSLLPWNKFFPADKYPKPAFDLDTDIAEDFAQRSQANFDKTASSSKVVLLFVNQ